MTPEDLPHLYQHQADPAANRMAGFSPRDRDAFMAHWERILSNDAITKRTVVVEGEVAGNVVCFPESGRRLVGYWIDRRFWGRGVATAALADFLKVVRSRPLHAFVFEHNAGSIRVLEKCGFRRIESESREFLYELAE